MVGAERRNGEFGQDPSTTEMPTIQGKNKQDHIRFFFCLLFLG